ncbi:restriction endonuclease [Proteobacteria bacterium 005FR1]|nr:restriction endonuclease [Proteobacteria bacterium 005FR1]
MKAPVTVREFARLTTSEVEPSIDCAQVPQTAFDSLCELSASFRSSGAPLVHQDGKRALRLDNFVGVLETPCGTRIEILPKHTQNPANRESSRTLLRRMLNVALDLPVRQSGPAGLELFHGPLTEWVMQQFLLALDTLVKRGVRYDYQRLEEEQRFLRGQLNVVAQMRQAPGRQHYFHARYDLFTPNRAENRLLRSALERVCRSTRTAGNWRLAHELRSRLQGVPLSTDLPSDFKHWRRDRLMAHYETIRPWCELVLGRNHPVALAGDWPGISMLFPMERLFERYVEVLLGKQVKPESRLLPQRQPKSLCEHRGSAIFRLKPDLLLVNGEGVSVLDCKWKLLNSSDREGKYGLSQSDFYQLFAYGHRYLQGLGELILIYPRTDDFREPLEPFDFPDGFRLHAMPFDLEGQRLIGFDAIFPA